MSGARGTFLGPKQTAGVSAEHIPELIKPSEVSKTGWRLGRTQGSRSATGRAPGVPLPPHLSPLGPFHSPGHPAGGAMRAPGWLGVAVSAACEGRAHRGQTGCGGPVSRQEGIMCDAKWM